MASEAENWRPIAWAAGYEVSDLGRLRSRWTKAPGGAGRAVMSETQYRIYKPSLNVYGYMQVVLTISVNGVRSRKNARMCRLVLEAFVGPCPDGMEACHHNCVRTDDRLVNLRWDTKRANREDSIRMGTIARGSRNSLARLTEERVLTIWRSLERGGSPTKLARLHGVDVRTIWRIKYGETWRHVTGLETRSDRHAG